MNSLITCKWIVRIGLACALFAILPACQAQQSTSLSKHGRKIHRTLSRLPQGSHLRLVLRDGSERYGSLGEVAPASFTFTDSDDNTSTAIPYEDVSRAGKGVESVSTDFPRHRRFEIPLVILGAAGGAALAMFETSSF